MMLSALIGALVGLIVVASFVLGAIYGKSIKIEVNHSPKFEEEDYLEQPKILDPEVQKFFDEGGFKF